MGVRPARIATAARARLALLSLLGVAAVLALGGCGVVLPSGPGGDDAAVPPPASGITVPDLRGHEQTEAVSALEGAGFRIGEIARSYTGSIPVDVVVWIEPAPGSETSPSAEVALIVSAGPHPTQVPKVKGKKLEVAEETLRDAGFFVETVLADDPATEGTVVAQEPDGGRAQQGTTIVITVSRGVAKARVPNVVGLDWVKDGGGVARLERSGFKVAARRDTSGHPMRTAGSRIVSQSPVAGSLAARGAVVRIIVAVSAADSQEWRDEW